MPPMATAAKKALRRKVLHTISTVSEETRRVDSRHVLEALMNHGQFRQATNIGLFISMPLELQTREIITAACLHAQVFVPKVLGKFMSLYSLNAPQEIDTFQKTKWGIPEPDAQDRTSFEEIAVSKDDLLIVPCVAFNRDGRRLGHGGGYYDRFITMINTKRRLAGVKDINTIGIALGCQVIDEVIPTDEHDIVIQTIIARSEGSITD